VDEAAVGDVETEAGRVRVEGASAPDLQAQRRPRPDQVDPGVVELAGVVGAVGGGHVGGLEDRDVGRRVVRAALPVGPRDDAGDVARRRHGTERLARRAVRVHDAHPRVVDRRRPPRAVGGQALAQAPGVIDGAAGGLPGRGHVHQNQPVLGRGRLGGDRLEDLERVVRL
jgi:hypothetical protein